MMYKIEKFNSDGDKIGKTAKVEALNIFEAIPDGVEYHGYTRDHKTYCDELTVYTTFCDEVSYMIIGEYNEDDMKMIKEAEETTAQKVEEATLEEEIIMEKENLSKKGTAHIDKSVWGDVSEDCRITNFKLWENYGKKRIYVTDYQGRKICYIDCNNNNEVVAIEDNSKVIANAIEICAEFIEKFNF